MARHLHAVLFLSDTVTPPDFRDCADDDGAENAPLLAAAVRARVLHRDTSSDAAVWYGLPGRLRRFSYSVEVSSVAWMVPDWIAHVGIPPSSERQESYLANLSARVDTFQVMLEDLGAGQAKRWAVCDPRGRAVSGGDGPGFWAFVHSREDWRVEVVRWVPAGASWNAIVSAAKSTTAAGGGDSPGALP